MRFVCLANSFREGGRCLGGIELNNNQEAISHNGRPRWIRPVCRTEHEQVPNNIASGISLLDIVDFQGSEACGHGHQTENILLTSSRLAVVDKFPLNLLHNLTDDNTGTLFGNRGAAVPEENTILLNHSLMLLSLNSFSTNERVFEGRAYPQIKLAFIYEGTNYNLPITDPDFLHQYGLNKNILTGVNHIYATISLTAPHEGWSSKLVAGIMFSNNNPNIPPANPFDDMDDEPLPF